MHIFTPTDQAQGDHAVYDIDQAVLVLTGHDLKLTTPNDVITARDDLEYWSQKHMAVARGNAVVVTNDGRRIAADMLVAYTTRHAAAAHQARRQWPRSASGAAPPTIRSRRLGQAGAGRGVRQCRGAHRDRHRARRSRRLCAGHRHGPDRRPCADHPRPEPARTGRRRT